MSAHKNQPLTAFPKGKHVRIEALEGGSSARCRLCALGLTPGSSLEICSSGPGPCRLKVRGADLVLGHGLAEKVLASPLN
jgi:ferrous iron transport protein A